MGKFDHVYSMFLGKKILGNNPDDHVEDLVKFKDNPDTKQLNRWVFIYS